jgi:dihydrolipoamide dehydrogenase
MMKIVVIGGGPGGYVAALRAAIAGADVTLVEKQAVGGTCLNRGCIPTKTFLFGSDTLEIVKNASQFGIEIDGSINANFDTIYKRKNALVNQLVAGIGFLLKKRGVKLVNGYGKLVGMNKIEVAMSDGSNEIIETDKIILATGSLPNAPTMFQYDGDKIFTSDEALAKDMLPKSIIIVGGGVIGCEFGQFYSRMGTKVTIVEMAEHILPLEDNDVAKQLHKVLINDGIDIYQATSINKVEKYDNFVSVVLSTGEEIKADCMLISVGRKANIDNLGLEELGVTTENGKVVVNNKMETSVSGIYAIGDIVNTPLLAHVASREGVVAAENAMGENKTVSYVAVPRCVYTEPEVAGVGLTEKDAIARSISYKKGKFNFAGIGKAVVSGKTNGFVKILADEDDKIIGASIVGPHATELISELTLAVHIGLSLDVAEEIIHAHPTLSEALMEAIHDVKKHSVHSY